MNKVDEFKQECLERVKSYGSNSQFKSAATKFVSESIQPKYSYNFTWMGRPIIQYPQDIVALQEIFWDIQPDLVIETGIAHGGSIIYYASLLELIGKGEVLGIDVDIRSHNRTEIENHPMFKRITMFEGSSVSPEMINRINEFCIGKEKVIVVLDSNHTHDHVYEELELYAPFVTPDSYLVVFDTIIEDMPNEYFNDRPWGKGNNPKTAIHKFLAKHNEFIIDKDIENKLLITTAPDGYLKRIK